MTLICTFPPKDDESGFGYYRRLAAGNALYGWREIAVLANVSRSRSAIFAAPGHIADELGLDPEWTQFALRQEQQSRGSPGLHRSATDAVCPACLGEDIYLRDYWQHAYATVCPVHRLRLVDHCQGCGEFLSPNRERIELCPCGHDLRTLSSPAATAAQTWLSTLIASKGAAASSVLPKVQPVDTHKVCELVRTLCGHADPLTPPRRRNAANPKSVHEAVELLAPLDQLLSDWPKGFERHVVERMAAGNQQARTLNTLLGQWYLNLKKACQGSSLDVFLESVVSVAARDFDGVLGLDGTKKMVTDVSEYVRLAEASKALGVSRDTLKGAVDQQLCAARTRRMGTRGLVYEVSLAEVERIRELRSAWITEDQACEVAGVSAAVLKNMVAAKIVDADPHWRRDILKAGPINRPSLLTLFDRVSQLVKPAALKGREVVSWAELTSRRMGDKRAIQQLMRAIADAEVFAVVRGRHLGQMGFLRSDIAPFFGTPVLEPGMSVQQLSEITGWKWESISHWMSQGLLESQQIILRGQHCRVVSPQQLLAFRQSYVPLADLAKAMGTKSSWLTVSFQGLEIVGAKCSATGVKRGGLVRMADLGRLALKSNQVLRESGECVVP